MQCRFGSAGYSEITCADDHAQLMTSYKNTNEQVALNGGVANAYNQSNYIDLTDDSADDDSLLDEQLFGDAVVFSPDAIFTNKDLPGVNTHAQTMSISTSKGGADQVLRTRRPQKPRCHCVAPPALSTEMKVRVDISFVDDVFITSSFEFNYRYALPVVESVVPPFGAPGTVVTFKTAEAMNFDSRTDPLLGLCRFGDNFRDVSPAHMTVEGFRCVVPKGAPANDLLNVYLSTEFDEGVLDHLKDPSSTQEMLTGTEV
jgi:archaellin